jgi:hypothetical protein
MEERLLMIAKAQMKEQGQRRSEAELLQLVRNMLAENEGKEYILLTTLRKTPSALFSGEAAAVGAGVGAGPAKKTSTGSALLDGSLNGLEAGGASGAASGAGSASGAASGAHKPFSGSFGKEWQCAKCGHSNDGGVTMICSVGGWRGLCDESAPPSAQLEHAVTNRPIGDPQVLLGRRIEVEFKMIKAKTVKYFAGTVVEFDESKGKTGDGQHKIKYDDGDVKWHSLKGTRGECGEC